MCVFILPWQGHGSRWQGWTECGHTAAWAARCHFASCSGIWKRPAQCPGRAASRVPWKTGAQTGRQKVQQQEVRNKGDDMDGWYASERSQYVKSRQGWMGYDTQKMKSTFRERWAQEQCLTSTQASCDRQHRAKRKQSLSHIECWCVPVLVCLWC